MIKHFLSLLSAVLFLYAGSTNAQNATHPTIDKISVIYKSAPTGTVASNGKSQLKVMPEALISLKSPGSIAKVKLEITAPDNTTAFSGEYLLASQQVFDSTGFRVFYIDNSVVHIRCAAPMDLKRYKYKASTTDNQSAISPEFIETK